MWPPTSTITSSGWKLGGNRYSFIYAGDVNGDGQGGNDLIYIPESESDIILLPTATQSAAQQWTALNAFIEQDDYLSKHRGEIAERFGAINPWYSNIDLRILQDLSLGSGARRHNFQLSVDMLNFANLFNSSWGVRKTANPAALSPLKLVDFGIARSMNPARPGDTTAYGTPGYAPLEQYVGKATPRSDLYALGATLYQLVTARAPEEFSFRFLPARQLNPELSPEMEALLAHLLQKDQEHRPATAREVQARLEPLTRPRPWMARAMGRAAHWMAQRKRSRGPSPPSDTRLPPS